jgi:sugar/nucleoside kinase (ribokinase family)
MAAEGVRQDTPGTDDLTYDVLCYGTISLENVTRLSQLPNPRRDATALYEYDNLGGEALNVALALATWGLRVAVAGNFIGTDRKGEFIRSELARHPHVDTRYIVQHPSVITPFTRGSSPRWRAQPHRLLVR